MTNRMKLTRANVRRLAIRAQHLDREKSSPLLNMIQNMGCVQLDPVTAIERSHMLVLWSRGAARDHKKLDDALDKLLWQDKSLFEYWAHAASIVTTEDYPIHAWYMAQEQQNRGKWLKWAREQRIEGLDQYVLDVLRTDGPSLSRDIADPSERYEHVWSSGRYVPHVLHHLWIRGDVMVVGRKGRQRVWGLTEQFLPEATHRETLDVASLTRRAATRAIRALGAATPKQIEYHYTRGRYPNLNKILKAMVRDGTLEAVDVVEYGEALPGDWYICADDIPMLNAIQAGEFRGQTTLLSPFDNLICDRDRTEALFDFPFRIEIYVPKAKREFGYYVMPILHKDRLVGRIDPAYDRKTNTLHIQNVYSEKESPKNMRMVNSIRCSVEALGTFIGATNIQWGNVPESWAALRA